MLRYSLTDRRPVRPTELRFCVLSAEEIEKMSVVEVTDTTLYYRGLPASGGLLDPLMGSVDRRHLCASCMLDARACQGHAGHIRLAFPVYHIGFVETVLRVLRCVCFCCARCVATPEDEAAAAAAGASGRTRLNSLHATLRGRKTCPHCGMSRPSFTRSSLGIRVDWPADLEWTSEEERVFCTSPFTAREAFSILSNMNDEDIVLLGLDPVLSHPRNMILRNLVVPPPCTRPAIYSSEGSRSRGQNELTVRLSEILRRSLEVRSGLRRATPPPKRGVHADDDPSDEEEGEEDRGCERGSGEACDWGDAELTPDLLERVARLQYEVYVLVNSNTRLQKPPGMGRAGMHSTVKSLADRLKGKEGRLRGNLMGKRVDYSARCVITPDACFECDRIGVPYSIAKRLTIPEPVTSLNIRELTDRVRRGSESVHGAQTVLSANGDVRSLSTCLDRDAIVLQFGDVVERHLADDDVVVFNRQPSLHMHGMQAHRVRLMPGHTFRMSLAVAAPYNADFDGDEMNVHVPQSRLAAAECAMLMGVAQNCVSSQSNRPVLGIVQDALLGLHLVTAPAELLTHAQLCRLVGVTRHVAATAPPPAAVTLHRGGGAPPERRWTGRQAFSLLLPQGIVVETGGLPSASASVDAWAQGELPVVVRDGQLLCGTLRKTHIGTSSGGIVDVLCRDRGGVACVRFLSDAQRFANAYLLLRAHHVGVTDVMMSMEGQARVAERLSKAVRLCEEVQAEAKGGPSDVAAAAEGAITRLLSKTLLQAGGIVNEHMGDTNAIRRMVTAGSKGSFINLSQICACLGQQSLEGARIMAEGGGRTLPSFSHDDTSLPARGMVVNSFALGLSPTELFFHAVGGREGLVDTAVKTSQTGYLQRRMNKSMEDHVIHPDGTVRDARGDVLSFVWGSDGLDPTRLERVRLPALLTAQGELRARLAPDELETFLAARRSVLTTRTGVLSSDVDTRVLLPFHPGRIQHEIDLAPPADAAAPPLTDDVLAGRMRSLCARSPKVVVAALTIVLPRARLRRMRGEDATRLLDRVERMVQVAACTRGKSVGCLAAQSIGEPATQMTLNTFHSAGCAAKNVTLGIPRLKELIDVTRSPKTPCLTIRLRRPFDARPEVASLLAGTFPLTRLGDVVSRVDFVASPAEEGAEGEVADEGGNDREGSWSRRATAFLRHGGPAERGEGGEGGEGDEEKWGGVITRLVLAREFMCARGLTPPMLRALLRDRLRGRAEVWSAETNMLEWWVLIHFAHVPSMLRRAGLSPDQEEMIARRATDVLLETAVVGGHPFVSSAAVATATRFDAETGKGTEEHVVHAFGTALADCAASDVVEWERCTSNDLWENYFTLGIEACAQVLFDQLATVVSFDGTYVDPRHIMMIVDTICRSGALMPLNRHGINRTDASPLMRASFEETTDILCDAAMFAASENARGVTTSIMAGQLAKMGTGNVDVFVPASSVHNRLPSTKSASQRRAMRSVCRSYATRQEEETMEYVLDDVKPAVSRPLSPPDGGGRRKRMRFRLVSPTKE